MLQIRLSGIGTLHEQVFRAVRDAIVTGHAAPDSQLPSTRSMAKTLGVSRITTLSAYERLTAEGLLYTRPGGGTFVAPFVRPVRKRRAGRQQPLRRLSRVGHRLSHLKIRGGEPPTIGQNRAEFDFRQSRSLDDPQTRRDWIRTLRRSASRYVPAYPDPSGDEGLRESIANLLMRWHGFECAAENVLITSGAQQALHLHCQVLLDRGDLVAMENPGYPSARYMFELLGMKTRAIPVDEDGADLHRLRNGAAPKLIYLTPAHQFPLGSVLSYERRLEVIAFARSHRCWIIEDDYDGQYRYVGSPVSSLKLLDDADSVCHVGTFSKTFDPSLRLGYAVVPTAITRAMRVAKAMQDQGSPSVIQHAMSAFIEGGAYERHLVRARKQLAKRRERLLEAIDDHLRDTTEVFGSETGSFVTARLSIGEAQLDAIIAEARRRGVTVQSASPHYVRPPKRATILLGYGGIALERIDAGVRRLAQAVESFL